MSDIVKKEPESSVEKLRNAKQIKLPSLASRLLAHEQKVREADSRADTLANRIALVLDCSGSMSGQPISLLRQAVEAFADACNFLDTSVAIRPFPEGELRPLSCNKFLIIAAAQMLNATGGTLLGAALQNTLENLSITRAVLVSDGEPTDSWHDVVGIYAGAEIPVDTVHIGDSVGGEDVLRTIASQTGGIYMKFKNTHSFATSFSYLTPAKRGLIADKSADEVKRLTGANDVSYGRRGDRR